MNQIMRFGQSHLDGSSEWVFKIALDKITLQLTRDHAKQVIAAIVNNQELGDTFNCEDELCDFRNRPFTIYQRPETYEWKTVRKERVLIGVGENLWQIDARMKSYSDYLGGRVTDEWRGTDPHTAYEDRFPKESLVLTNDWGPASWQSLLVRLRAWIPDYEPPQPSS